jgi:hypothetical protein
MKCRSTELAAPCQGQSQGWVDAIHVLRGQSGAGATIHNMIDASGADPAAIARWERVVRQLNSNQSRQAAVMSSAQRYQATGVS